MKILIAGGSGFVGRELSKYLSNNHHLTLLTRSKKTQKGHYQNVITWQELDSQKISVYDIVINLCGYSIGERRWSKSIKKKIVSSRVEPTQKLIKLIDQQNIWLINASAIGYYVFDTLEQDEDSYIVDENRQQFSQNIVRQWESKTTDSKLKKYTILRFGVVIGKGGVLEKMTLSAKFGFLTIFGSGSQLMSWISINDLSRAVEFIINNNLNNQNVFNLTAPNTCQNATMIKSIKKCLGKKLILKMPAFIIKSLFGQMGNELLLSSQNIKPQRLSKLGFKFNHNEIHEALKLYLKDY